jgi:two-component system, chemotaxis family, protein-glutamate methylesterase/glutaminase
MIQRPIHVLVVDDSKVMRLFLAHLLESDPQLRVIGTVDNGQAALDFIRRKKPDVVLMDIHMPGMDGFESTRLIMQTQPVPIVICSATTDTREVEVTFRLLEAGAVACVNKPTGSKDPESAALTATMIETVKLMSEIKVVKRWARSRSASASPPPVVAELKPLPTAIKFIGMGASTGGPPVLHTILA